MDFDYDKLRRDWKWEIPEFYNIGRDCTDRLAQDPERSGKTALIFEDAMGNESRYTFSDISLITNRIANAFLSIGVRKGERVAIRLDNCPEFPFVFLGAIKIGAIPIPSSHRLTGDEFGYILSDSGAVAVVTSGDLYPAVEEKRDETSSLRDVLIVGGGAPDGCVNFDEMVEKSSAELDVADTRSEDACYICYTSGTTGFPKGAIHAQRALIGREPATTYWQGLIEDDVILHSGKLNWTYTLGTGCIDPWRFGCTVVLWGGPHDIKKFFELIEKYRVTVFMGVPTVFRQMLRILEGNREALATLRHAITAGEHLTEELYNAWTSETSIELYDGLGMSEFSYYLTNMVGMPVKPGSPGRPQPGHRSTLLDEMGREVQTGEVGVLATPRNDPGLMLGYWNRDDETDDRFSGDWFLSGDYFYRDSDGYYWFVGRNDDVINTFGFRVSPFEVERVLNEHPRVRDCAVAGVDVGHGKTIVVGFVILEGLVEDEAITKHSIVEHLSTKLADYKCPKEIEFLSELPTTLNGKIKRRVLRENFALMKGFI